MALVCNVFEMLYQLANLDESRYTYTLLTATKKELHIYQWFMVSFVMSIQCHLSVYKNTAMNVC